MKQFFTVVMLVFSVIGCEIDDREFDEMSTAEVKLELAPSLASPELTIIVEVFTEDLEGKAVDFNPPIRKELKFTGELNKWIAFDVPIGENRIVEVQGFEYGELVLKGRSLLDFVSKDTIITDLTLDPVTTPILAIGSAGSSIDAGITTIEKHRGDEVIIEVKIKNVSKLFGVVFELDYTHSRLSPLDVELAEGSSFARSLLPVTHDLNLEGPRGQLSVALTLTNGQSPITIGSDYKTVALVKFRATSTGIAEVNVKKIYSGNDATPIFVDSEGNTLEGMVEMRKLLDPSDVRIPRGKVKVDIF